MSVVSVNFDLVKKNILKYKRVVYYLLDGSGNHVIAMNEDADRTPDDICQEIEDHLQEIQGNYVSIRLHAKAPGESKTRGGRQEPLLQYKIDLKQFRGEMSSPITGAGAGAGSFSNSQLGMFQMFFTQINDLKQELIKTQYENRLKELEAQLNERKGGGMRESALDYLGDKVVNKLIAIESAASAAKGATGAKAAAGTVREGAALAGTGEHKTNSKKIIQAVKNLHTIDPDNYLDDLQFMSDYAKNNPEAYKAFIKALKDNKNE